MRHEGPDPSPLLGTTLKVIRFRALWGWTDTPSEMHGSSAFPLLRLAACKPSPVNLLHTNLHLGAFFLGTQAVTFMLSSVIKSTSFSSVWPLGDPPFISEGGRTSTCLHLVPHTFTPRTFFPRQSAASILDLISIPAEMSPACEH